MKRLHLGLTDAERRVREANRRLRNLVFLGVGLALVGLELINLTHWRNW